MKNAWKKQHGFTLLELTIVIVVIGILVVLSLPAGRWVLNNASYVRSVNNARQFVLLVQTMTYDSIKSGYGPTWTYDAHRELMTVESLTEYMMENKIASEQELARLLSAGDVLATRPFTAETIAWKIFATTDSASTQPVMVTKNWDVDGLHEGPGLPYGLSAFILARKDGSVMSSTRQTDATDEDVLGLAPQDFPEALQ